MTLGTISFFATLRKLNPLSSSGFMLSVAFFIVIMSVVMLSFIMLFGYAQCVIFTGACTLKLL